MLRSYLWASVLVAGFVFSDAASAYDDLYGDSNEYKPPAYQAPAPAYEPPAPQYKAPEP